MKKIIVLIIVAAALGAGTYVWSQPSSGKKPSVETTNATVTKGSIRTAVASTGRVMPNLDVQIKCKASGEITKLPFDVSDQVKKGDLLLQIDPIDEDRMVKQSKATLASSQARLEIAKTNLAIAERDLATEAMRASASLKSAEANAKDARAKAERVKALLASKLASPEEAETAETTAAKLDVDLELAKIRLKELETKKEALKLKVQDVKLSESDVESDMLKLQIQEKRRADTEVVAPITGVVSTREVQIGQIISSGISNVGGGTTTMVLSDLSRIFVLASVDESDIGQVKVDQPATITADAFPGREFEGKVIRIATQGINLNNVVTFEVKIEVIGRNKAFLKPEMTANVAIITAERTNALLVPSEAVVRKSREFFVEVKKGETKEERKVKVGLNDMTNAEIVSGLAEGETVIVRKEAVESRWSGRNPTGSPLLGGAPGGRGRH
jgi:HlyD family secretion protein